MIAIGAVVSRQTARSDRMFLQPGVGLTLYGSTFEATSSGRLVVNGELTELAPSVPVKVGQWEAFFQQRIDDGTLVVELRQDKYGRGLVFAGYMLFGVFGLLSLTGRKFFFSRGVAPGVLFPFHVGFIGSAYLVFLILPFRGGRKLLQLGVWLLGMGIAVGSVWASTAWGRYWGWDPKETGALALFLLYCLPLHFPGIVRGRRWLYWFPIVLMFLLFLAPGLHQYLFR